MKNKYQLGYRHFLVILWLIFTVALTIWLFIFTRNLFSQLLAVHAENSLHIDRQMRMIQLEIFSLIIALVLGGGGLLYLTHLERKRSLQIREFFATFTHELKTSLASLRIQAEAIGEDLANTNMNKVANRLLNETTRLELQLENSLFLARDDESSLFIETVSLAKIVFYLKHSVPLRIHLNCDCFIKADTRALESILKNIIQNSTLHGSAENIWLEVSESQPGNLRIKIKDDGKGFSGDPKKLGRLFSRQISTSGSGIGLYIIEKLVKKMKGTVSFLGGPGFTIEVILPGSLAGASA